MSDSDSVKKNDQARWLPAAINDLVDIVVNDENLYKPLLINPSNRPTTPQYLIIRNEMQKR